MSIRYRPEIDGLRAIAVIAVLLCHAKFDLFAGGFVGVDIFFVISGFLITSLIMNDLHAGKFSFINFWERRIRRILPPLFVVVLATLTAGWFLHLPVDYEMLGQQVAAQSVFASNILFKMQAGYFDSASVLKPLLHTWSLAVEEQFYLLFPLAAYLTWTYRREKFTKYIWVCWIITFIAAAFIVRNSPSSAFYLLPFRAWELLLGSLLAVRPQTLLTARASEFMGNAGLAAILISILSYNEDTTFPGLTALLPCLGTAAIIVSNHHFQNSVGRVLSMKMPVFIGLISYSLYLWHWPIISFIEYSQVIKLTPLIATFCILFAIILAVFSWQFIETPIRKKVILATTRQAYIGAGLALITLAVLGLSVSHFKGIPSRLNTTVVQYAAGATDINPHRNECNKPSFDRFEKDEMCLLNEDKAIKPTFAIWGDSHADAAAPVFYELATENKKNGYVFTADACPPILGYALQGFDGFSCPGFNERVLNFIEEKNIKHVVLISSWAERLNQDSSYFADVSWYDTYKSKYSDVTAAALQRTIDLLQKKGVKVYLMFTVPIAPFDPPRTLALESLYGLADVAASLPLSTYKKSQPSDMELIIKNNKRVTFIDPALVFCDENECRFSDNGKSLYYNDGHISTYGASKLKPLFEQHVERNF